MDSILQSLIFTEWNKAKHAARAGVLDTKRTNRALGIIMSGKCGEKFSEYSTTYKTCGCPDCVERGSFCKHRIAFIVMWRVYQKTQEIWVGDYKVVKRLR
jgi:hypothetical protein